MDRRINVADGWLRMELAPRRENNVIWIRNFKVKQYEKIFWFRKIIRGNYKSKCSRKCNMEQCGILHHQL